jgi:YD repeat-containing protein
VPQGKQVGGIRPNALLRRFAVVLAAAPLWVAATQAEPIAVSSRVIPLSEQDPEQDSIGVLHYRGGIEISSPHRDFGGLSGLRISTDGLTLHAVTDHGGFLTARLSYDAYGRLLALTDADLSPLPGSGNTRRDNDAEALTEDGSGGWIVAFEQRRRLMRFVEGGTLAREIAVPAAVRALPRNTGIEALAHLPDGRLLMLAEYASTEGIHQGWIGDDRGWQVLAYVPATNFSPTDAVSLPSGDALVVERAFHPVGGWGARVVYVERASLAPGQTIRGQELAVLRPPLSVDNIEGIAAISVAGAVRVYLISDDNFNFLERTLLLSFQWEGPRP